MQKTASFWVDKLQMLPHPEGGFYKETFRADLHVDGGWGKRSALTSIFYLLEGEDFSGFHRIKSTELWYHHTGGILLVHEINTEGILKTHQLSAENPFAAIQANSWFASEVASKKDFVLVSCAVAPGFDFIDFELAKREELTLKYPAHKTLFERLCRI
jgi:predicted cupin superfamily sugar epimerase